MELINRGSTPAPFLMPEFAYESADVDPNLYGGDYKLTKKDKTYIDISLAFTPNPVSGDISLLLNERAINNAIKNIVLTTPGEVTFFRDYGTMTNEYLFDFIDEVSAGLLQQEIERAIKFCEPRVSFDEVPDYAPYTERNRVTVANAQYGSETLGVNVNARPDQNEYEVTIKYRIVGGEQIYRTNVLLTPTR